MLEEITLVFSTQVPKSDLPTAMLVAVMGKQDWKRMTWPNLRLALNDLLENRLHGKRVNVYGLDDSKEETSIEFFERMHREGKFIRILLYKDRYFVFQPGVKGE